MKASRHRALPCPNSLKILTFQNIFCYFNIHQLSPFYILCGVGNACIRLVKILVKKIFFAADFMVNLKYGVCKNCTSRKNSTNMAKITLFSLTKEKFFSTMVTRVLTFEVLILMEFCFEEFTHESPKNTLLNF